jgi:vanadium-dependent haloperoxidase-like protein
MRRVWFSSLALLVVAAVVLAGAATKSSAHGQPAGPPDTYITNWDAVFSQAFTAAALTPPDGFVISAYTEIAVYDSVMAIEGGYRPFAVDVDAPRGASAQAAVAAAAHRILVHYLPAQKLTILDPAYAASLATIFDGKAKTDGIAVGEEVADILIAQRADDGFRAPVTYTPPNPPIPGVWIPTAPTPPIAPYAALMRPFSLDSADEFRPDGPPALGSWKWVRDYNEVKEIGSSTSTTRTAEQTVAARFWGEPPVQQAHGAFRKFVLDHELDVANAARFMAMVSVVEADAIIACFDAKYHFTFWRPITAIRAGDTDGNPATVGDPNWSTLLPATPNHPEYPSAHSCVTPAGGRAIARFLGTKKIDFTVPSLTGLGDRHFDRLRDLQYEVSNARIWGGIHYRTSVEDGIKIAKKTANQVLAHHFQRARGHDDRDEDQDDD